MALALEEAGKNALEAFRQARQAKQADKPLWPPPYDVLTPEAAYKWLTECWWTENEANQRTELVPQKAFIKQYVEEWVACFIAKRPMWTEKSRRLIISWASRGLETWVMGLKRGASLIVDQKDENAGEHLWRVHYCLTNLYERRPEMNLKPHKAMGSIDKHNVSDVILPNGSWMAQSHQEAGASQGKGKTIVTLEELSKYKSPTAFVGQAIIVAMGEGGTLGGWVNGIANASPNPDWHSIKPDGKDSNGKDKHVKAAELLEDASARVLPGFSVKDLSNGDRYLAIHYTADEAKRDGFRSGFANVPPREWEQEMELSEDIHAGKVVYETYVDDRHSPKRYRGDERIPLSSQGWLVAGWDCGSTMRPGFALVQITPAFQVRGILEVTSEGNEPMSMFAPRVLKLYQALLPATWPDVIHVGDGTIRNRMGNIGKSAAEIARPILNTLIKPMSNNLNARMSAVTDLLLHTMKAPDGNEAPRFVLDGGACPVLRAGFNGGYKFAQTQLMDGSLMYSPEPVKNKFADPHDALQYCAQEVWRIIEGKSHGKISRRG